MLDCTSCPPFRTLLRPHPGVGRAVASVLFAGLGSGLSSMALAQRAPSSFAIAESVHAPAPALLASATQPLFRANLSSSVTDPTGAPIPGASAVLATEADGQRHTVQSEADGSFRLTDLGAGPYTLTVSAPGARPWAGNGVLEPGQSVVLPEIALTIAPVEAFVQVSASRTEIAAAQIELAEKQRILGVFPNFYASYVWDAAPLTAKQKFSLAWRFSTDPVAFSMAATVAGVEQSQNGFAGYGQGVTGYGKRFGAAYGDGATSTLLGQAVLPAILHQDPRYFVKGTGSVRARTLYALANTVLCRGDSGHWQVNVSNIAGNMGAASISNLYYPASSRHGAALTIENSIWTTASGALGNLMQEFLLRHMTPNVPDYSALPH